MKIEIANNHHEGTDFAAWLNANGHDAHIGTSTGNYVNGSWTSADEDANDILTALWNEYCQS